jgi:hypothetical protein
MLWRLELPRLLKSRASPPPRAMPEKALAF